MRPFRSIALAVLTSAVLLPSSAHAQACSSAQLAANPLVGMGFRALTRINDSAFDLSCYFQVVAPGVYGFGSTAPSVAIASGPGQAQATINQAVFDLSDPNAPIFNYGVASNLSSNATSPVDLVFAFASPLASATFVQADAQIGVTRASGNPNVSVVPVGAASTLPVGGAPSYLVAQSTFLQVAGGGSVASPGASNLGVDVGGSACTVGTACSYAPATSAPNASYSAWLTVVSYRQSRPAPATRAANAQVNGQVGLVATAVPEPATIGLTAAGLLVLAGVGAARRRGHA